MNRMPPAVEMDVVAEPSGPRLRQPRRHPILKCRRKPSAAGSRRSIGSASSSGRTRASGLASWGRCCAEKACIARTWRTGDGSVSSHSRPRVSNDNPFSEAQFRTFKYRPEFPTRFGALEHARAICHDLLAWYNDAHHHSGLSYLTPADVHYGRAPAILDLRHRTRLVAYAAHPERFVSGPPRPETLPTAVWINPPSKTTRQDAPGPTTGTPDDSQHAVVARPRPPLDRSSLHRVDGVESLQ